jgi:hypothetical protein
MSDIELNETTQVEHEYGASEIQVLEGLDGGNALFHAFLHRPVQHRSRTP